MPKDRGTLETVPGVSKQGPPPPADPKTVDATIKASAANKVVMQMQYRKQDGTTITRFVEPYSYRHEAGKRFLYAWCRIHREIHKFDTRSIQKTALTKMKVPFSNPRGVEVEIR